MPPKHANANPFYQPAKQWQICISGIGAEHVLPVEEAFGDLALAISSFEIDEATKQWKVDIITNARPELQDTLTRLTLVSGLLGIDAPLHTVKLLEQEDWVGQVEKSFPPLNVGRFYVYGSHVTTPPPQGKIALKISAGAAFGSGEHATTSGCLMALGLLARKKRFLRPLDMGCGSGILAIAMAKLWHVPVLGVDIDPVSVDVARDNARINRIHKSTSFIAGDGYKTDQIRRKKSFDCIVANILARPLMRMAPELVHHLTPGGTAILSGLLASQEKMVLAAHRAQGLRLKARIMQGGWNTLVIG